MLVEGTCRRSISRRRGELFLWAEQLGRGAGGSTILNICARSPAIRCAISGEPRPIHLNLSAAVGRDSQFRGRKPRRAQRLQHQNSLDAAVLLSFHMYGKGSVH